MGSGPSPLVPSLMVVALGLFICGPILLDTAFLLLKTRETNFSIIFIIPLLLLLLNPNPNALLVPQFLKTREKPSSLSSSYTDVVQFARVTVRNGRAGQQPVAFGSISDNQSLDRGNMWTESTEQRVVCVGGGRYDGLLRLYHPIAIAAYDILCE
ncbi:hypothetical protein AAC387_Pa08g2127 [Persea americana]